MDQSYADNLIEEVFGVRLNRAVEGTTENQVFNLNNINETIWSSLLGIPWQELSIYTWYELMTVWGGEIMSQIIKIRRGTKAELVARGALLAGEMGFCTDTKEVYIGDGTQNVFVGRVMMGTYVSRPNASVPGRFYYVTEGENAGYLYIDIGTAWSKVGAQKLTDLTGSLDDIADGTTYARVKKADITNGQVNKVSDGTKTATAGEIKDHIDDVAKHRVINDAATSATSLWSSQKTNSEIYNAIRGLEWQDSVKNKATTTPPTTNTKGDRYIIPSGATGAWSDKANQIAHWNGTAWEYYAPDIGWSVYIDSEHKNYVYNGTAWVRSGESNQTVTAGNGLTGGGSGDTITLNVGAGNGIAVTADAVAVKAYKGIAVDGNGVAANIDGSSIVYDAANGNRLSVALVDGGTF